MAWVGNWKFEATISYRAIRTLMLQGNSAGVCNEERRGGPYGPPRKSCRIRQVDASVFLGVGFK